MTLGNGPALATRAVARSWLPGMPITLWARAALALVLMLVTLPVDIDPAGSHSPHNDVADIAVSFAALWAFGVGGRGSDRALALDAGGSILVLAVALVVLAA
jgi:hypothetical protein